MAVPVKIMIVTGIFFLLSCAMLVLCSMAKQDMLQKKKWKKAEDMSEAGNFWAWGFIANLIFFLLSSIWWICV